jgi:uncharacterized protein YcbK (DUF882 family)
MTKISENFRLQEFDSNCGREMPLEVQKNVIQLGQNLQVLRDYLKASITINSGYRSPERNKKIKGATRSQHLLGTAADIVVKGHTPKQVADAIELLISQGKMREGGLKAYGTFTHYDIRGTKARW